MGTEGRFGPFCAVIADPGSHGPLALAVFPGDSARRYTAEDGSVNAAAAEQESTSWAERASLAVVLLSTEARGADARQWDAVVCRPDHYLEVVVVAQLPVAVLAEVRIRKNLADRLDDLQSRALLGDVLHPDASNEVRAYETLQQWRRVHGTSIRAVA